MSDVFVLLIKTLSTLRSRNFLRNMGRGSLPNKHTTCLVKPLTNTQNLRINRKNINTPKQLTALFLFTISMDGPLSTHNILQPEGNAKHLISKDFITAMLVLIVCQFIQSTIVNDILIFSQSINQ